MRLHSILRCALFGVMLVSLTACGHLGHKSKAPASSDTATAQAPAPASPEEQKAEAESRLRAVVKTRIEAAGAGQAEAKNRLERRNPYYFKQYDVYPDNADNAKIDVQKNESLTAPFLADVKVNKIRFSTRLHRNREEAASDQNFLRDTGVETQTYQYRNGKWNRIATLYVADKTEENVNGEWVAAKGNREAHGRRRRAT